MIIKLPFNKRLPFKAEFEQIIEKLFDKSKKRLTQALPSPNELDFEQARRILGKYRVAIEPNFIPWMQCAYIAAQSESAKQAILENIVDEVQEDHPKMLRDFTDSAGVEIVPQHYADVSKPVLDMWSLLQAGNGLTAVAIAATLENTSLTFIPYLAQLAKKCGCTDFTYTDTHGEADIEHAEDLYKGLVQEMMYEEAHAVMTTATTVEKTTRFLEEILT